MWRSLSFGGALTAGDASRANAAIATQKRKFAPDPLHVLGYRTTTKRKFTFAKATAVAVAQDPVVNELELDENMKTNATAAACTDRLPGSQPAPLCEDAELLERLFTEDNVVPSVDRPSAQQPSSNSLTDDAALLQDLFDQN
jgi:hypothetical protein